MFTPSWSNAIMCATYATYCTAVVICAHDSVVLYHNDDILHSPECAEELINPWICLLLNCTILPLTCISLLYTGLRQANCLRSSRYDMRIWTCFFIYYLPIVIVTLMTYNYISDTCWRYMNMSDDLQELGMMIAFHTWQHVVVFNVLLLIGCWKTMRINPPSPEKVRDYRHLIHVRT